MPPRACNPPKPLSTHCHMLHSRQCRRAATTPISRMDDTRHSNPDAMRWRIPSCDPGHDVRDPQPDRDRVVGPSAGGQPGLRDRGHSETAIDIGADLPFVEHRCPRIPEMDCTDDPAPVADHVPARTGSYKCRMHRGNGDKGKHGKDNQRPFQLERSFGLLRDNFGGNLPIRPRARSRDKGHSHQPVGVGNCVLSPANWVSTRLRNRTRAHPCSRYSLSPWHGPGNSTYRLVHRCGYTRHP